MPDSVRTHSRGVVGIRRISLRNSQGAIRPRISRKTTIKRRILSQGLAGAVDALPDSDIDLLVDLAAETKPSLLTLSSLQLDLAEWLGRPVDLMVREHGVKGAS
jgi:predicted nucleotidyltransferase